MTETVPSSGRSVHVTVERPSVYPIDRQLQRRAVGLLLSALRAGDIDRQLRERCGRHAAGAGAQQQRRHSTALSSKCGQRHLPPLPPVVTPLPTGARVGTRQERHYSRPHRANRYVLLRDEARRM